MLKVIIAIIIAVVLSAIHARADVASWYDYHGRTTANGEKFDRESHTCASRRYAFNTVLKVTNLKTGKSVLVRVNDRGPYIRGRNIDLSRAAFARLAPLDQGLLKVKIEKLEKI